MYKRQVVDRDLVGGGLRRYGQHGHEQERDQQEGSNAFFHARALLVFTRFLSDFA